MRPDPEILSRGFNETSDIIFYDEDAVTPIVTSKVGNVTIVACYWLCRVARAVRLTYERLQRWVERCQRR